MKKLIVALSLTATLALVSPLHAADPHAGHAAAGQAADIMAMGTLDKVGPGQEVTITHDPIPALGWPAMTMPFTLAPGVSAQAIKAGSKVHFTMKKTGPASYQVTSIQPATH